MTVTRLNGDQTAISEPVIEAMRVAGLSHLLSTSGFHVTVMGLLIYFPLRALLALIPWVALRYDIKKIAALGAIASAMAYTFLVGAQPATMRSLLMTAIAMLGVLADRRADPMRLVMLSAALGLAIAPDALLGASFQMSFAAVFCLVAVYANAFVTPDLPVAAGTNHAWHTRFLHYMWSIARTSLIATAATTPFVLYHFQTFSFYGFIANMMAIPLTSFWVMPCILMAYFTVPLGLDGLFINGAGAGIWVTIKIATAVAALPFSIIHFPAMPLGALILAALGGLWLCLMRQKWRYAGLVPVLVALLYPLYTHQPDFIVSGDGKEWAARLADGRLAVANLDRDDFTTRQWQERLGNPPMLDVAELPDSENQLRCDEAGCVYHHGANILALPTLGAATLEDCERANIIVTPFVVRGCGAAKVIDDPQLWEHGAQAIYFDGGSFITVHTRPSRGQRPWSPGWKAETKKPADDQ